MYSSTIGKSRALEDYQAMEIKMICLINYYQENYLTLFRINIPNTGRL